MSRNEQKQFSKLQNQACGLVNRLSDNGKITPSQATQYTMDILTGSFEIEHVQAIVKELVAKTN